MFVEKLTKEDFIDFIKNYIWPNKIYYYNGMENEIKNFKVEDGKICFNTNDLNFDFTDFKFSVSFDFPELKIHPSWLKFMYSKFGKAYEKEFSKYRETEKTDVLKEMAETFVDNTRNIAKNFDCGKE